MAPLHSDLFPVHIPEYDDEQAVLAKYHAAAIARINETLSNNPWLSPETLEKSTQRIQCENSSLTVKRKKLYQLADSFNKAIAGSVACRVGCAHCCSMITLIYEHEAKAMAQASGRPMKQVKYKPRAAVLEASMKFFGLPCPFLQDDCCSIYEDRPIICRLHHSFNDNSSQCDMSRPRDEMLGVSALNPDCIEQPYHALNLAFQPREPWGAVQDFFPEESEALKLGNPEQ
jgi:Fe-S-cluster containining protein